MNKDMLKKHHFWFLAGFVPLLALIAVLILNSSVGSAIEAKKKAITDANAALKSKENPKPNALLRKIEEQNADLGVKRGKLWKDNWDRQKSEFKWPANSQKLQRVGKLDLKFGDPIPRDDGEHEEFRDKNIYIAEFTNRNGTGMADRVAPTQFLNSWQAVLRHVANGTWGEAAMKSDSIWLAMEDIWVQRTLLGAVRTVNDQIAAFDRVPLDPANPTAPDNKLRRRFASRTWEIELWTEQTPEGRARLRGKLTNTTDRLQLLGVGNTMTLHVWLEDTKKKPNAAPFAFRIGTEFLPGKGATRDKKDEKGEVVGKVPANEFDISPIDDLHTVPAGTTVTEIDKVVQVFDARTVPIRRIDRIVLGQLDARTAVTTTELKKTEAMAEADKAAAAATTAAAPTTTGGSGGSSVGPPSGGRPVPGGEGGVTIGGAGASGGQKEGGGPVETVLDANRARYIEVSPNVRRMPVGIVLVIDQAYLQDVLLAYANSPLRFQITQVHWTRFRGTLGGLGTSGPSGGEQPGITLSGSGLIGGGFNPGSEGAVVGGRPGGRGLSTGAVLPAGGSSVGSGPGGLAPGGVGSGQLTTISESHLTSGLIEVCIYGLISLYEKYEVKPVTTDAKDTDAKDAKDSGAKDAKSVTPTDALPKGTKTPDAPKDEKGAKPKDPAALPDEPKGKTGG